MKRVLGAWKYKHTTFFLISLVVVFLAADTELAHALIRGVGSYGYLGAFFTGVFFVSTFTFAPATVVLYNLALNFNLYIVSVCAGAGAVLGDVLIFRFLQDGIFKELYPLVKKYGGSRLERLRKSRSGRWLAPVVGAIVIASPLPDEIGVALMGISKIKTWQFALLTFVLNTIGIFLLLMAVRDISL